MRNFGAVVDFTTRQEEEEFGANTSGLQRLYEIDFFQYFGFSAFVIVLLKNLREIFLTRHKIRNYEELALS